MLWRGRKKLSYTIKITLTFFLLLIPTGCWNFERLSERGLVTGIAMDKKGDNFLVGLESIQFGVGQEADKGMAAGGKPYVLVSKNKRESLEGALHGTQFRLVGLAFFPDYRILVIGKDLAKYGIKPLFDHQIRDPDMRRNTLMVIADGKGIDLLKIQPREQHFTGEYIQSLVKRNEMAGHVVSSDIGKVFRSMVENSTALIPIVKPSKDKKGAKIETLAVFKDFKMIDILNHRESEICTVLRNVYKKRHVMMFSYGAPCEETGKGAINLDLIQSKAKLDPIIEDNHLSIGVNLTMKGYIAEYTCRNGKIDQSTSMESIEFHLEEHMQEEFKKGLETALHRTGADLLDLQKILKRKPNVWNKVKDNFDTYLKNATVDMDVTLEIRLKGTET